MDLDGAAVAVEWLVAVAGIAAGLAVGIFANQDELRKKWREARRWSPNRTSQLRSMGYAKWKKAIERTLNWID